MQANSVADSLRDTAGIPPIVGGIRRIGEVTQVLVPSMGLLYVTTDHPARQGLFGTPR